VTGEDEIRNFFALFFLLRPCPGSIVTLDDHQSADIIDFFTLFPLPDA